MFAEEIGNDRSAAQGRAVWQYAVAGALAVPLTTTAHEGAHAIAAATRGFAAVQMHALWVSYRATSATTSDRAVVAAAGPLTTMALVLIALAWLRRSPASVPAAAVLAAAPLRSLLSVGYLLMWPFGVALARPSDEGALGILLGRPVALFAAASAAVLALAVAGLVWAARSQAPATRRALWVGLSVGAGVGWALELTVVARVLP